MSSEFARLRQVWETLGAEDPLWAVASLPEKRGGRWDVTEFLATGTKEVKRLHAVLQRAPEAPPRFRRVLDFGCGVGRLTLAWKAYAEHVVGVDISEPMLKRARLLAGEQSGITYVLNRAQDLAAFGTGTFDLCFSHICLQHMPWSIAQSYLREFSRLAEPGGWVLFQLPSRRLIPPGGAAFRQRLVDSLPFGLDRVYRRWRHGSSTVFEMHYTPREQVTDVLTAAGLKVLHAEPDTSGGPNTEGFVYVCRKPVLS